jgi:hypothetical protein
MPNVIKETRYGVLLRRPKVFFILMNRVIAINNSVHGFMLDPSIGEFVLTDPHMKIPARGKVGHCVFVSGRTLAVVQLVEQSGWISCQILSLGVRMGPRYVLQILFSEKSNNEGKSAASLCC